MQRSSDAPGLLNYRGKKKVSQELTFNIRTQYVIIEWVWCVSFTAPHIHYTVVVQNITASYWVLPVGIQSESQRWSQPPEHCRYERKHQPACPWPHIAFLPPRSLLWVMLIFLLSKIVVGISDGKEALRLSIIVQHPSNNSNHHVLLVFHFMACSSVLLFLQ